MKNATVHHRARRPIHGGLSRSPWVKIADGKSGSFLESKDGNLTLGKLRVVDYHVGVMVYLRDTSPQTIDALKQLRFIQTGESKAARLLIGSIDVRRLAELAKLDAVIRVTPVVV
jgi:hypothetical protein